MKSYHVDTALAAACCLMASAVLWLSASGCEQISMVFWATILSVPVVLISSVFVGWRRYTRRSTFAAVSTSVLCLGIIASVAAWQWPLRASYRLSQLAFDSLAQRVRAGEYIQMPRRVGLFEIQKAEVAYNGVVCLWTEPSASGNTGFAQCPRDYVPFNLWSLVKLDDHWQFISED
jgi:hypothetical protein